MHLEQQRFGGRPVDARIGDGHAVFQLRQVLRDGLIPRFQVTLEHEPDDRPVSVDNLRDAVLGHHGLKAGFLVGVPVAAVHDDGRRQVRRSQFPFRHSDADGIVIDPASAAAKHDVRMHVAAGAKYRRLSLLRNAEKVMRVPDGL